MFGITFKELRNACMAVLALTVITGVFYPILVYGLARLSFSNQAQGSLLERRGAMVGSVLIGQSFTQAKYFHPRPSAAGKGYDALSSGGSNLGPLSEQWLNMVRERATSYRQVNALSLSQLLPMDAVTASGSGLDPHISPENAALQLGRVAQARHLDHAAVQQLVKEYTEQSFFGGDRINVLQLNLALDFLATSSDL